MLVAATLRGLVVGVEVTPPAAYGSTTATAPSHPASNPGSRSGGGHSGGVHVRAAERWALVENIKWSLEGISSTHTRMQALSNEAARLHAATVYRTQWLARLRMLKHASTKAAASTRNPLATTTAPAASTASSLPLSRWLLTLPSARNAALAGRAVGEGGGGGVHALEGGSGEAA